LCLTTLPIPYITHNGDASTQDPSDVMNFITGNKPLEKLIKEKAVLLHEKMLRIPGNQYWKIYENKPRHLKMKNGFIKKVIEIDKI